MLTKDVITFYSPSGKLVQIEYALAAVAAGAPSVGIKALNGVVLATENKHKSILYDEHSVSKVEMITKHIGMVYSGMGPDYRILVKQARKMAQQYLLVYREPIPTAQLVQRVAMVMQEYTQSGWAISLHCDLYFQISNYILSKKLYILKYGKVCWS